jgi:hypothetical protein
MPKTACKADTVTAADSIVRHTAYAQQNFVKDTKNASQVLSHYKRTIRHKSFNTTILGHHHPKVEAPNELHQLKSHDKPLP